MQYKDDTYSNICVLHFGQLGDVVLSIPALAAIRERFQTSRLTFIVGRPCGEIIQLLGIADDVVEVDRVRLRDSSWRWSVPEIIGIVRDIRRRRFDLVIDLHSLKETNILGFLSGAPVRLFANREGRSLDILSNFRPRPPREIRSEHISKYYLRTLEPLGINSDPRLMVLDPREFDLEAVAKLRETHVPQRTKRVGLFLGAGHPSRRWQIEKFAELARRLIREAPVSVEIILGPEEETLRPDVEHLFPRDVLILEKLTLGQLAAAFAGMDLLVSHDTGPTHLASVVGTPIVMIQGSPFDPKFNPVMSPLSLITSGPVDQISVNEVYEASVRSLSSTSPEKGADQE